MRNQWFSRVCLFLALSLSVSSFSADPGAGPANAPEANAAAIGEGTVPEPGVPGQPGGRRWDPARTMPRPGMGAGPDMGIRAAQDALARFDSDKDGKLNLDEYLNYQREKFSQADIDSDLGLDAAELNLVVQPGPPATQPAWDDPAQRRMMMSGMLKRLDVDGDGKISKSEATSQPRVAEQFDAIDVNKDGLIDEAELESLQARMAERLHKSGPGMGAFEDRAKRLRGDDNPGERTRGGRNRGPAGGDVN